MARNRYTCTAPDGTTLECTSPDYVEHAVVLIGLMRLRKALPKINPDDEKEETRYERFKSWIMIGGAPNEAKAQQLAATQGYRGITEETRIIPVVPIRITKAVGEAEDGDEPLKVVVEAPALKVGDTVECQTMEHLGACTVERVDHSPYVHVQAQTGLHIDLHEDTLRAVPTEPMATSALDLDALD